MALIYPVLADAPEPEDGSAPDVGELAADLSDQWLVEVAVGEDGDDACFGPLAARRESPFQVAPGRRAAPTVVQDAREQPDGRVVADDGQRPHVLGCLLDHRE